MKMWRYIAPSTITILIAGSIGQYFGADEPMTVAAGIAAFVVVVWEIAQMVCDYESKEVKP